MSTGCCFAQHLSSLAEKLACGLYMREFAISRGPNTDSKVARLLL